jgi:transglutaminase-like putative cysteine protease
MKGTVEVPAANAYFLLGTRYVITGTPQINQIVSNFKELGYGDEEIAEELCHWVHENIQYELVLGQFTSEEVLSRGRGKCLDMANLYLALVRTAGIPARRVDGFLIVEQPVYPLIEITGITPDNRFIIGHAWVEVCLFEEGWVFVDPTKDLFRTFEYEDEVYSSVEETWQEVLASHEIMYGELT